MNSKKIGILLFLSIISFSCSSDIYNLNYKFRNSSSNQGATLVQMVVDNNEQGSLTQHYNLKKTCDYTKIPYGKISSKDWGLSPIINPSTRVLAIYSSVDFSDAAIDTLLTFVAKGGTLFVGSVNRDKRLNYFLGIKPGAASTVNRTAYGFNFKANVLPKTKGLKYQHNKKERHNGLAALNFDSQTEVLLSAFNNANFPLLTAKIIEKGKVVYFNSNFWLNKQLRGILFSSILSGLEGIAYPIANTSTIFLDDFPSPLYNVHKAPIQSELNIKMDKYVLDIWWKDMKKLATDYDIDYTALVAFNYNGVIKPPFTFEAWDANKFNRDGQHQNKSTWVGKDVLKTGHEIGLHGYNHVSLVKKDWKGSQFMATALEAAAKKWKIAGFGSLPTAYVPPSNYIDSIGIVKLKEGMPSLKYMSSVYNGQLEDGGNREFDPDPYHKGLFDYPRISSGFFLEPASVFNIESLYLFTGIWTHFVHPDDVFQIPSAENAKTAGHFEYRNKHNLPWYSKNGKTGLFDVFKNEIIAFKEKYPLVRFLNATKSSELVYSWRTSSYQHENYNGEYSVIALNADLEESANYWFVYTSRKNEASINSYLEDQAKEIKKTPFLDGFLVSVNTEYPIISIPDFREQNKDRLKASALNASIDYDNYTVNQELLLPLRIRINKYIADKKVVKASGLLQKTIEKNTTFLPSLFNEYAKYMAWQDKTKEAWDFYEMYYQNNKTTAVLKNSNIFAKNASFPDQTYQEKWLYRQIEAGTDDIAVFKTYVANCNTENNTDRIEKVLQQLYKLEETEENKKNYFVHLLDTNPEKITTVFKHIDPCFDKTLKPYATRITWVYADLLKYDKALQYAECSTGIDQKTKDFWLVNSTAFERYKDIDYPRYIALALANNEKKAIEALDKDTPCREDIKHLSKEIALAYSYVERYKKALDWGDCLVDGIEISNRLSWLYQSKQYHLMASYYNKYIKNNFSDYKTMLEMATYSYYEGDLATAFAIGKNIPMNDDVKKLKIDLNKELKNADIATQAKILPIGENFIFPKLKKDISDAIRLQEGNAISITSQGINDKDNPNNLSFAINYSFLDGKRNIHKFSLIQSDYYELEMDVANPLQEDNLHQNLVGLGYTFKRNVKDNYSYWGGVNVFKSKLDKYYYHFKAGINKGKEERYTAIQLQYFPVQNTLGHQLDIYRTQLDVYTDYKLFHYINASLALEANYYTDSNYDATLVSRFQTPIYHKKNVLKISPLLEAAYNKSSADGIQVFPYWITDKRVFGGTGLIFDLGSEKTKFNLNLEATYFLEQNENDFQRYTGELSYKLLPFTKITGSYQFFTIENFYSNEFLFGLVHEL